MTALTGETGAGKSLLIDAIGLLLGDRASSDVVRTGESKAVVEGLFTYDNPSIDALLETLDIEKNHHELMIKRQITTSNNNIIKVNHQVITLKDLKQITAKLADIHTQEDTLRLINPLTYLDIIDGFNQDAIDPLKATYQAALKTYKEAKRAYNRLLKSQHNLEERLDLLRYQEKELSSFHLKTNEKESLEADVKQMENYDTIFQTLRDARTLIDQSNAVDIVYDTAKKIENLSDYSDVYKGLSKNLESTYYDLLDHYETLIDELAQLDFDPSTLDASIERLNDLERLEHKYKKNIPDLIAYLEEIRYDINNIDHYDDVLKDHENIAIDALKEALEAGQTLSITRQEIAQYIEETLMTILTDLELPDTTFNVAFESVSAPTIENDHILQENGIDTVDFMLSTNVGEPVKPLSRSASGGEMSRIMLGFKNVLADSLGLSLMIFDEIDTGVSGFVAHQVAKKMKHIAQTTQVICITHIPQVAAISDHHVHISKHVENHRTKAIIQTLEGDARIKEIASMMSGDKVSEAALKTAKELLQ
jgi:DNA repair protein RecN (Recombination protein N)